MVPGKPPRGGGGTTPPPHVSFGDKPPAPDATRQVEAERDALAAKLRAACERLGGNVHGRPVDPDNFLERIDSLLSGGGDAVRAQEKALALREENASLTAANMQLTKEKRELEARLGEADTLVVNPLPPKDRGKK
jgi:hypothetical protein